MMWYTTHFAMPYRSGYTGTTAKDSPNSNTSQARIDSHSCLGSIALEAM